MWTDGSGNKVTWGRVALAGAKGALIGGVVVGLPVLYILNYHMDALVRWTTAVLPAG